MSIFAILTRASRPAVKAAIAEKYPVHYEWSDKVFYISTEDSARTISDKLFTDTETKNGVIAIRVAANYYGYSASEFWDWISARFSEDSNG